MHFDHSPKALLLSAALLLGCPGPEMTADTGNTDAPSTADAPSSGDAPALLDTPGSTDAPASDRVALCQTLAATEATECAGSAPRPCIWGAYGSLCATGNTELLIGSIECLDVVTCRAFSDPNEGRACLEALHASDASTTSRDAQRSLCTACGGSGCDALVLGTSEILPYLSDADITTFLTCRGDACTLDAMLANCMDEIPALAPFAACGG